MDPTIYRANHDPELGYKGCLRWSREDCELVVSSMTEQIDERKIATALFQLIRSNSAPEWFTEQELAVYLRLLNKDGRPVTSGIRKWAARDPEDNPLPRRYVGDLPRFFRPDIIRWTEEETRRHNTKNKCHHVQEKTVVELFSHQEDNASTLTAAAS